MTTFFKVCYNNLMKDAKKIMHTRPYVIAAGMLVIVIGIVSILFTPLTKTKTAIKVVQPTPKVSPFPAGQSCTTSKATGAMATDTFSVQNLVGDGKTDDYKAIQSAIDNAGKAGGGIVRLPTGTFLINGHLTMRNNVTLEGAGPTTIIKAGPKFLDSPPAIGYSIVNTNGASNVTIENFTADQQGNILNGNSINRFLGYVIHVYKSNNVIVNGVYTRNPFAYSIVAEDSSKFCFKNNNTQVDTSGKYDQLDGIHVLNSSYGDVIDNYVDQGHGSY